jgi:hypothetical protein
VNLNTSTLRNIALPDKVGMDYSGTGMFLAGQSSWIAPCLTMKYYISIDIVCCSGIRNDIWACAIVVEIIITSAVRTLTI